MSLTRRRIFVAIFISAAAVFTLIGVFALRQQAQGPVKSRQFASFDEVTAEIRSAERELVRIDTSNADRRTAARSVGRVVADHGSFVIVSVPKGSEAARGAAGSQKVPTTVHLPGARFEPVAQGIELRPASLDANGNGYYIVQFGSTVTDEWLNYLARAGLEVVQYIPHQAFLVHGPADALESVRRHPRVRWTGSYLPEHKISDNLREQVAAFREKRRVRLGLIPLESTQKGRVLFDVAVFAPADVAAAAGELRKLSGAEPRITRLQHSFFNMVRVELRPDDIDAVAAMPDVFSLEPVVKPVKEDERSAQIVAGNYSGQTALAGPGYNPLAQFGVDGTGVTVSVVDDGVGIPGEGGFYITNSNSANAPLRGADPGGVGHGHLNATIIAGALPFSSLDPLGYNYGLGIAPKANIVNIPMLRAGYSATYTDIYNDSLNTPGPNGVVATISNNSWGAGTNGNAYNAFAAQFDSIVRDASLTASIDPILIVFSAGNSGAAGLTQPKMAKNVIAVANSENLRSELFGTNANNIDDIYSDSSRGPAADGRVKPDISAPGSGVAGGRAGTDSLFGNIDDFHRWSTGTSHAAPQVAGAAALFAQWWTGTRWGDRPSPALLKAAVINTGQDMNGVRSTASIPNGNEGWGRLNMKYMLNTGTNVEYIDEEVQLGEVGATASLSGSVLDPAKPVRVTLVWTDPPGTADPALVNDLDLIVTIGDAVYKGNVFSSGLSATGGSHDTVNNVENVFLPAGFAAGTPFTVTIRAAALNGDGILGNADPTDQSYGLVAYNFSPQQPTSYYTVSGRVRSPSGRGVQNAIVRLRDAHGVVRERITNQFGFYTFGGVAGGQNYEFSVWAKRYTFGSQTITVASDMADLNITATTGPL